jgi:phosphopantetheinyl transferase
MVTRRPGRGVRTIGQPSFFVVNGRFATIDGVEDEIRVYVARPARVDAAIASALVTQEEHAWLQSFRFERDRHEHLVSRALVRASLGHHLHAQPESFRFRLGAYGKPSLEPAHDLFFNASNNRNVVVCALARYEELGVDVEPLSRAGDILEVVETVFSTHEIAVLRKLPLEDQRQRATTLWTVKEAYIKALGLGLSAPVRDITIDLDTDPWVVVGAPDWFLAARDLHDARIAVAMRGARSRPRVVLDDGEALIARTGS